MTLHRALAYRCWVTLLISSSFSVGLLATRDREPPEPEALAVVYYLEQGAETLTPLEKQVASIRLDTSRMLFGVGGGSAEINGAKSPVRLKADERLEFIVSVAPGTDPSKFMLYV